MYTKFLLVPLEYQAKLKDIEYNFHHGNKYISFIHRDNIAQKENYTNVNLSTIQLSRK